MKYGIYLLAVVIAVVLQKAVVGLVAIYGIVPDLILIVVCSISLLEGRARGTIWGFAVGLLEDSIGSGLLGSLTLARSVVAFLAGHILHFRTVQNPFSATVVVGLLSVLNNIILFLLDFHSTMTLFLDILMQIIFPSLYTAAMAWFLFAIIPESVWEKIYETESLPFG